jgi:hypothetical protein
VGVHRVAHVELDAERLPPGDEAPADHEQRLDEADHGDECDELPEQLFVAGLIARSITLWLMRTSAIAAACDRAASTIEMKSDQR